MKPQTKKSPIEPPKNTKGARMTKSPVATADRPKPTKKAKKGLQEAPKPQPNHQSLQIRETLKNRSSTDSTSLPAS